MILTEVERLMLVNQSVIMAALIQRETEPALKAQLFEAYNDTGKVLMLHSRRAGESG